MARNRILLIDDEAGIRFGIRDFLEIQGYEVGEAETCREALEKFESFHPDAVLIDYRLPDGNALELLPRLKAIAPEIPLVILTAHGSIDLAVQAVKEGAEQFLTKPIELPALLVIVERLLENQRNRQKQTAVRARQARNPIDPFLGNSRTIRSLAEEAGRVVAADSPILIQGETGAGKGVLARWIHDNSPRAEEAFVDLNCAGLSQELLETELFGHQKGAFTGAVANKTGLLEVAHRGTVFLDEIGDINLQIQPKLLKVLEEKRFRRVGEVRDRAVDIRLIAASHQNLLTLVREKRFRSDLYFRISAIPLLVPPLRDRAEDIPLLAENMLARITADMGRADIELWPETVKTLQKYPWPGNIRELRNVLERAVLLSGSGRLSPKDLRFDPSLESDSVEGDADLTLEQMENRHIERALKLENWHVEKAARRLGVPRSSLYQKIKKYGINIPKN